MDGNSMGAHYRPPLIVTQLSHAGSRWAFANFCYINPMTKMDLDEQLDKMKKPRLVVTNQVPTLKILRAFAKSCFEK